MSVTTLTEMPTPQEAGQEAKPETEQEAKPEHGSKKREWSNEQRERFRRTMAEKREGRAKPKRGKKPKRAKHAKRATTTDLPLDAVPGKRPRKRGRPRKADTVTPRAVAAREPGPARATVQAVVTLYLPPDGRKLNMAVRDAFTLYTGLKAVFEPGA